jgi:hypothetical protein
MKPANTTVFCRSCPENAAQVRASQGSRTALAGSQVPWWHDSCQMRFQAADAGSAAAESRTSEEIVT